MLRPLYLLHNDMCQSELSNHFLWLHHSETVIILKMKLQWVKGKLVGGGAEKSATFNFIFRPPPPPTFYFALPSLHEL